MTSPGRKKLISIITVAFNEEDCVEELARRLQGVFQRNPRYDFEVVAVDNGSTDRTHELLEKIHEDDPRFKIVELSRNFRMDGGMTAGLAFVAGDAAVLMAADLQDPPELITEFLRKWEDGYEHIYMVVRARTGAGPLRRVNSRAFYWLAGKLTGGRILSNVSDYRLVDQRVYRAVRDMDERNRFLRGLFSWAGFRSIGIESDRPPRHAGRSKAHSLKVLDLALKGILAHSVVPLRMILLFGVGISVAATLAASGLGAWWVASGQSAAGLGTLVAFGVLGFGLLTSMLGMVAEYVGLIYEEVKQRPSFVVRSTLGLPEPAMTDE